MRNWSSFEQFVAEEWKGNLAGAVDQVAGGVGLEANELRLLRRLMEVRLDLLQVRLLAQILTALEPGR